MATSFSSFKINKDKDLESFHFNSVEHNLFCCLREIAVIKHFFYEGETSMMETKLSVFERQFKSLLEAREKLYSKFNITEL